MDLVDSHLDISHSFLDSSQFSDSSQLLESRLSTKDMDHMQRENLLLKLLQLHQSLENTQKQNQLLRIEKAQLRTQLKNTKTKAKHFIQNNIVVAQSIFTGNYKNEQKIFQSPAQTTQNFFITPNDSDSAQDLENQVILNKVFIKSHKRGISNNCIVQDRQTIVDPKTYCQTLMNSPKKQQSIKFKNPKPTDKSANKIIFPKNKLNALVAMERQQQQANGQSQNKTLDNFQSFCCHKKDDLAETQKWGSYQNHNIKPKFFANNIQNGQKPNNFINQKPQYNNQKNNYSGHKIYQPFQKQQTYQEYEAQQSERDKQKCLKKSTSSSNLSNKNYCSSGKFKIPTSIDEIWGSSKNFVATNGNTYDSKTIKLSKVNANKAGLQRKSYLNF